MRIENRDEVLFICDFCGEECEGNILTLEEHPVNHFCTVFCAKRWQIPVWQPEARVQ